MTPGSRQAAFADLHAAGGFLRPNPRNVGSARRMAARGLRRSSSGAQSARVTDATIRAAVMGMPAAGHAVPLMQAASGGERDALLLRGAGRWGRAGGQPPDPRGI